MKLPEDVTRWMEEHAPPPKLSENDLTPKTAAEFWEVSERDAKERLLAGVEAGELKVETRISPGNYKEVDVYVVK